MCTLYPWHTPFCGIILGVLLLLLALIFVSRGDIGNRASLPRQGGRVKVCVHSSCPRPRFVRLYRISEADSGFYVRPWAHSLVICVSWAEVRGRGKVFANFVVEMDSRFYDTHLFELSVCWKQPRWSPLSCLYCTTLNANFVSEADSGFFF